MTASVHPLSSSHVRSRSNSFTLVPNRRTSPTGFWFASPIRMQTAKNFFPTSIPAHFSTLTSSMAPPSRRETDAFMFTLSRGLDSTNRRFVLRRPDHFPNGVVSTIYKSAISLRKAIFKGDHPAVKRNPFILGGGPQGHETFLRPSAYSVPASGSPFSFRLIFP